jgi:hypothetical protein
VTTANLDGESNLKKRTIPLNLPVPRFDMETQEETEQELYKIRGVIICDKPNVKLDEFLGKILINKVE